MLTSWLVGAYAVTVLSTCLNFSVDTLDLLLQAVAVLLLTIAGWAGRRAATTSQDAQQTLQALERQLRARLEAPEDSGPLKQ